MCVSIVLYFEMCRHRYRFFSCLTSGLASCPGSEHHESNFPVYCCHGPVDFEKEPAESRQDIQVEWNKDNGYFQAIALPNVYF